MGPAYHCAQHPDKLPARLQLVRQQAHQALAATLPDWPASLDEAQAQAGCRVALGAVVAAVMALQAHPPGTRLQPRPPSSPLMALPLRPLPEHDRRRAAAGDRDDT